MATRPFLDTAGIGDLLRDMRKIDKTLGAAFVKELRASGDRVRDQVRSSTAPPYRTGRLRRSTKTSVRGATIALVSKEPYANVAHWGGTIEPRGSKIRFPETRYMWDPAKDATDQVRDDMENIFEATANRYEFRGP